MTDATEYLRTRVLARMDIVDHGYSSPCWVSNRATQPNGYTKIGYQNRTYLTHRVSYAAFVGPVPDGLVLDHLCRVRACVNPDHMEPVTTRENLVRGHTRTARQVAATHCPQGHAYDEANTYWRRDRLGRMCRLCRDQARRRSRDGLISRES